MNVVHGGRVGHENRWQRGRGAADRPAISAPSRREQHSLWLLLPLPDLSFRVSTTQHQIPPGTGGLGFSVRDLYLFLWGAPNALMTYMTSQSKSCTSDWWIKKAGPGNRQRENLKTTREEPQSHSYLGLFLKGKQHPQEMGNASGVDRLLKARS